MRYGFINTASRGCSVPLIDGIEQHPGGKCGGEGRIFSG